MKMMITAVATALLGGGLAATPGHATGKIRCSVAADARRPMDELKAELVRQGWTVAKAKLDGGCYEVYGVMPDTGRVEAYFDPATFEKLYVEQRGKVLFKKG